MLWITHLNVCKSMYTYCNPSRGLTKNNMKNLIALGGVIGVGVIAVFLANQQSTLEITNEPNVEIVEKIETVDVLSQRIEASQEAARAEIEAEAQAAYERAVEAEMTRIADEVKAAYIAEIEETISADAAY